MAVFYLRKRIVMLLLLLLILLLLICYLITTNRIITQFYYAIYPKKSIKCYRQNQATLQQIDDDADESLIKGQAIFFHETSCNSYYNNNTLFLYARQACAVESAAHLNPNKNVYLLFASPGIYQFEHNTESDRVLQALLTYDNIKLRHINYERYTKGTPVEELYRSGAIDGSGWAQSHASDVLRYLTLWKYGGIYLDLDVIVIKSFDDLPKNFAGSESDRNVAAGVLGFDVNNNGHRYAEMCLNDLKQNFEGSNWGNNGPGVITRLLRHLCNVDDAKDMLDNHACNQDFKVYPPYAFYPIRWQDWHKYFNEEYLNDVNVSSRNSYAIHVWNKHSVDFKIPLNANVAYTYFAKQYCPKVYQQCYEYF